MDYYFLEKYSDEFLELFPTVVEGFSIGFMAGSMVFGFILFLLGLLLGLLFNYLLDWISKKFWDYIAKKEEKKKIKDATGGKTKG